MVKIEETRNRFEEKVGEGVTDDLSDQFLKKAGEMVEKLNIDNIDSKQGFVKILEEIKGYEDPKITKTSMAGILGVKKRQINNIIDDLVEGESYVEVRNGNQEKEYAHPDSDYGMVMEEIEDKTLGEIIREAHERATHIIGGYREPTLEEVAKVGGLDFQENRVRRALHRIKAQESWTEPSQKEIEDWKDELTSLIAMAVASTMENIDPMEIPGEDIYSVEEYAEKNKDLIDSVEIKETKVGYDLRLPTELVKFTDQRIISFDRVEESSEGDVYTAR